MRSDLDYSPEWRSACSFVPASRIYLHLEVVRLRNFGYSHCTAEYSLRLPMPSWPVAFAALPNGRGAVAAEALSQLPEPISQSARRLPRVLFRVACRSRLLLCVAVGGSRPTAVQTVSAHPADVQIVEDFLGILKWQWLEPYSLISKALTRHCRAAVLR